MATRDLVQSYYDSLSQKNDKWQNLYSNDAVFSDASKTLNAKGKAAVIQIVYSFSERRGGSQGQADDCRR